MLLFLFVKAFVRLNLGTKCQSTITSFNNWNILNGDISWEGSRHSGRACPAAGRACPAAGFPKVNKNKRGENHICSDNYQTINESALTFNADTPLTPSYRQTNFIHLCYSIWYFELNSPTARCLVCDFKLTVLLEFLPKAGYFSRPIVKWPVVILHGDSSCVVQCAGTDWGSMNWNRGIGRIWGLIVKTHHVT